MKAWLLLLLLPLAAIGAEESLHSRDFAYGMSLEVDGDGALYSLPLPDEVYEGTVRKDLGDLRIFNGYGEVVPHLLKRQSGQGVERKPMALNFFPLYDKRPWEEEVQRIHIADDGKGTIIDIERGGDEGRGGATVAHYLIDASPIEEMVEKLVFDWSGGDDGGFMVPVRVEYSNDLVHWHHLVSAATLADLDYGGYSLSRHAIDLPRQEACYYRIGWPLGEQGVKLNSVQAEVVRSVDVLPHRWRKLSAATSETRPGEYTFTLPGHYPVDSLRVSLPQANTVVQVKLLSRDDEKTPWRVRYQGLRYTLQRDGQTLESEPITLPRLTDSFWLLEVEQDGGGIGSGLPQLEVGWVPQRLLFVARGEMPFTLAFGAGSVLPPENDITELVTRLEQSDGEQRFIKLAHAGGRFELGGEPMRAPPKPPLPWKKWLLWAVLIIGVLLLAMMARGIYRQMNSDEAKGEPPK